MRKTLVLFVTIILVGVAAGSDGAESGFPDPAKWDREGVIRIFEQNGGALLSGIYRRGGVSNGGAPFSTFNDMTLRDPNSVQTLEATVTLLDASATSGVTTFRRAGLEGLFYWNGSGSGFPGAFTGHLDASLVLVLNTTTGQLAARYLV